MTEQPQFWMVYGMDQGAPIVRHAARDLAETEAKRLARSNPGVKFFVLEAVSLAEKIDVQFTRLMRAPVRASDDEIPF